MVALKTTTIETTSRLYKSQPVEGDIPLKDKYIKVGSAPRQNHHSDNQRKGPPIHRKLTAKEKALLPVQPVMVRVVDMKQGFTKMMTAKQFADLDWGWKI